MRGIDFIDNDYKEALRQAQEQNKLIFIDGYANWCVPCKLMDEEVFIHPSVYEYFNENFINLKLDLEKGIGPLISARHNASTLPFYMFMADDETLIHSVYGFQRIHEIVQVGGVALEPGRKRSAWDQRYAEGDRKPAFLYNYAFEIYPSPDDQHKQVVDEYLASSPDMSTDRNIRFVYNFVEDTKSDLFEYLVTNQRRFHEVIGKDKTQQTIDLLVDNAIHNSNPPLNVDEVADLYIRSYPAEGQKKAIEYRLEHYKSTGQTELYRRTLLDYYVLFPPSREEKVKLAKEILDSSDETEQLELMKNWISELSRSEKSYELLDLKSELELRLGQKQAALHTYKDLLVIAKGQKDKVAKKKYKLLYKQLKKSLKGK